jgi:hypothetical protein
LCIFTPTALALSCASVRLAAFLRGCKKSNQKVTNRIAGISVNGG